MVEHKISRRRAISSGESANPLSPELAAFFDRPLLIEGEDLDVYNGLYDQLRSSVGPIDPIEEILVRNLVDLAWEATRYRRLKAALFNASTNGGMQRTIETFVDVWRAAELTRGWAKGKSEETEEVEALLKAAGYDEDTIRANTFASVLNELERIDHLIMQVEGRFTAIGREIDRHRGAHGDNSLIRTNAEDAKFEDLPSKRRRVA